MNTYDLVVTLEELFTGLLEAGEPPIIVIGFATVLLLHRPVVLEVRTRVLLQVLLLLVSQMCCLRERYVLGDGGLARPGEHGQVSPLMLVIIVSDCYYHLLATNIIKYFIYRTLC
jgi:hypothetical protein